MNNITYRKVHKNDYATIKTLINKAFKFEGYIKNPKMLDKCLTIYLRSCLASKTFSSVAVKDGNVIGIILGSSKNNKSIFNSINHNLMSAFIIFSFLFESKKDREHLKEYLKISKSYDELIKNRKNDFQGCIDLFIVSNECQGLGVGKQLVSNLMAYMKDNSVSNLYLYTDSNCNYGFYDSQGFKQLDSRDVDILTTTDSVLLNVYLYGYHINV
ncbi:MAG: GNAT family N-acetyltransferase [Clostridium sp.]